MAMTQSFSRRPPPSTFPSSSPSSSSSSSSWSPSSHGSRHRRVLRAASSLQIRPEDIAELARNKVLIAATVASTIGQLSKPFTSCKDRGGVDIIRTAVRSGGMPSTHSAAVIAVTTSLGLERGFGDSIFGMSVVFAAIVMYDAQGVRREVGNHARVLNTLWTLSKETAQNPEDGGLVNATPELPTSSKMAAELASVPEKTTSSQGSSNVVPCSSYSATTKLPRSSMLQSSEPELAELKQAQTEECINLLNESVGHTELQVTVGAMLGFVVSLAVHATLTFDIFYRRNHTLQKLLLRYSITTRVIHYFQREKTRDF